MNIPTMTADEIRSQFGSYLEAVFDHEEGRPFVYEVPGEKGKYEWMFEMTPEGIEQAKEYVVAVRRSVLEDQIQSRENRLNTFASKIIMFKYNHGWLDEKRAANIKAYLEGIENLRTQLKQLSDGAEVKLMEGEYKVGQQLPEFLYEVDMTDLSDEYEIKINEHKLEQVNIYDERGCTASSNPYNEQADFTLVYSYENVAFQMDNMKYYDGSWDGKQLHNSYHARQFFTTMQAAKEYRREVAARIVTNLSPYV